MSAVYRLRQGARALTAFARPLDASRAQAVLPPSLLPLFSAMRRSEQMHSLAVLAALEREAPVSQALAFAALLHDCGKARFPLRTWQRTLPVLLHALAPAAAARLAARDPRPMLTRGFVVYAHHPRWGAALAHAAGAPEQTCWLIEHHADPAARWAQHPYVQMLKRLQRADDTR